MPDGATTLGVATSHDVTHGRRPTQTAYPRVATVAPVHAALHKGSLHGHGGRGAQWLWPPSALAPSGAASDFVGSGADGAGSSCDPVATPFLNSLIAWPSDRDSSGSFLAPKRKTPSASAIQRSCGPSTACSLDERTCGVRSSRIGCWDTSRAASRGGARPEGSGDGRRPAVKDRESGAGAVDRAGRRHRAENGPKRLDGIEGCAVGGAV